VVGGAQGDPGGRTVVMKAAGERRVPSDPCASDSSTSGLFLPTLRHSLAGITLGAKSFQDRA
jgi:hypothetical protein